MDLFVIRGIVGELQQEIAAASYQDLSDEPHGSPFPLRRQGVEKNFVISTHPEFFRLHLSTKKYANPQVPPRFCTYLRSTSLARNFQGEPGPYERVVRIGMQKKIDAGLMRELILVVES